MRFIVPVNQSRTKPRPAPDHLPKLGARTHFFEKHQIQHFGNVDARVHHINGNCNLRERARLLKIVDLPFRVLDMIVDDGAKSARKFRKIFFPNLINRFRVAMILRKNNRFPERVPVADAQT